MGLLFHEPRQISHVTEPTANRLNESVYISVYNLHKCQFLKSLQLQNMTNIPGDSIVFFFSFYPSYSSLQDAE